MVWRVSIFEPVRPRFQFGEGLREIYAEWLSRTSRIITSVISGIFLTMLTNFSVPSSPLVASIMSMHLQIVEWESPNSLQILEMKTPSAYLRESSTLRLRDSGKVVFLFWNSCQLCPSAGMCHSNRGLIQTIPNEHFMKVLFIYKYLCHYLLGSWRQLAECPASFFHFLGRKFARNH